MLKTLHSKQELYFKKYQDFMDSVFNYNLERFHSGFNDKYHRLYFGYHILALLQVCF